MSLVQATSLDETNSLTKSPVHRWLSFSDSWPPSSVERLLDAAKADSTDAIYDPFVGCGTTPVVCAQKGIRTVSCDVSPLAVTATRIKLTQPGEQDLNGLERIVERLEPATLLASFADGTLGDRFTGNELRLLKFVLAAVLMRVGWHEGNELRMAVVSEEIARLITEMRADIATPFNLPQPHRVLCSEFPAIEPADISPFVEGRLVLISSPPFFGSNSNPAEQRLASLMDEPVRKAAQVKRLRTWAVPEALPILEPLRGAGESYDSVADYLFFLDRIAAHAVDIHCRCVAVEMGPKKIGDCEVRFDIFLAQRLLANDYRVDLFETAETEPEICTFICAHSTETSRGAIL
jgi:hypothetical protein